MLHARLFGPLRLAIDEQPVPDLPGLRPRALLAYLLLRPGPHARAHLAAAFWPDVLDTSARASLRSALHTIRVALDAVGGGAYLAGDRAQIGIARALPRLIDSERFDSLLAGARRPPSRRPSRSPTARCWPTWPTTGCWRRATTIASVPCGRRSRSPTRPRSAAISRRPWTGPAARWPATGSARRPTAR